MWKLLLISEVLVTKIPINYKIYSKTLNFLLSLYITNSNRTVNENHLFLWNLQFSLRSPKVANAKLVIAIKHSISRIFDISK
jgi:hypothetical protein